MMRAAGAIAAGALALAVLAACGSEQTFRDGTRQQILSGCRSGSAGADSQQLGQLGLNHAQTCECAVDRYLDYTPSDRLREEMKSNAPPPAFRNAYLECAANQLRRPGGPAENELPPAPANAAVGN